MRLVEGATCSPRKEMIIERDPFGLTSGFLVVRPNFNNCMHFKSQWSVCIEKVETDLQES